MKRILATGILVTVMLALPAMASDAPAVGDVAPDFRLQDQDGEWRSLENYRGQWVVMYFYPKDDTPGCTTEACSFRDDIYRYRAMGAAVLGISLDDVESHQAFAEKYELPFPLLADTEHTAAKQYGVLTTLGPMQFARRETFLIDPAGRIARHYPDVEPEAHAKAVLADLQDLMEKSETPDASS